MKTFFIFGKYGVIDHFSKTFETLFNLSCKSYSLKIKKFFQYFVRKFFKFCVQGFIIEFVSPYFHYLAFNNYVDPCTAKILGFPSNRL